MSSAQINNMYLISYTIICYFINYKRYNKLKYQQINYGFF
jgi:hypothetical protein